MSHACPQNGSFTDATEAHPFHFPSSGLSNVYLVGISVHTCECGRQAPRIPALEQLMQVIARDVVKKPASLVGEEIRFLRKRLGSKAANFAHAIGVEPETLSRWENDKLQLTESMDKLIRLYFLFKTNDPAVRDEVDRVIAEWKSSKEPQSIVARIEDNEWAAAA